MQYAVICYAIHNKRIASYNIFDNESEAYAFVETDATNTYTEEYDNSDDRGKSAIDFTLDGDGTAHLSSCGGEYQWTWEIICLQKQPIVKTTLNEKDKLFIFLTQAQLSCKGDLTLVLDDGYWIAMDYQKDCNVIMPITDSEINPRVISEAEARRLSINIRQLCVNLNIPYVG